MTKAEIAAILQETGMPVIYLAAEKTRVPDMPFITYFETGTDNFAADGIAYSIIRQFQIDLFRAWPMPEADEEKTTLIEDALTAAGIFWNKANGDEQQEHCVVTTYTIEV